MRAGRWSVLMIGLSAAGCAPTLGPATPPVEVLVVLDSLDDTLRIIPVDSPGVVHRLNVGSHAAPTAAFALHGRIAAIGYGDSVTMFDLGLHQAVCRQQLNGKGPVGSLTFDNIGRAYAATPSTDSIAFINVPGGCGVGQGSVRGRPQGFGVDARGTVFALVSNTATGWLISQDPQEPQHDSIPLGPPGNTTNAVSASDGSLYVVSAGGGTVNGVLARVDPVQRSVVGSFAVFGRMPSYVATDGADRVYVASPIEGLMVFNVRTHQVDRGPATAVALPGGLRGIATDDFGRVYALITGSCAAGSHGNVQPLDVNLVAQHPITVGRCPTAMGVTEIPAALYRFDN